MAKRGLLARVGFAVTAVVASAALLTSTASSATASRAPAGAAKPAPAPVVGANAFSGQGRLAFVSAGKLYVLDGTRTGRAAVLDPVAAPADVVAPAFSADGKWVAFLVTAPSSYPQVSYYTGTLWLARADGTGAHPVLANASTFAWSPASDVLAVTVYPPDASVLSELDELGPGMSARLVHGASGPAAWSPDGRQIAFASMSGRPPGRFTGLLETMPAAGGTPVVRYRSAQNALDLAGWWPDGRGLLAWVDEQSSASLAADGLPLVTVPLSSGPLSGGPLSGTPATFGTTLVYPAGGSPVRIVARLFSGAWPNYYYYIDWPDQFAWYSKH
jgi:hypothetical protein